MYSGIQVPFILSVPICHPNLQQPMLVWQGLEANAALEEVLGKETPNEIHEASLEWNSQEWNSQVSGRGTRVPAAESGALLRNPLSPVRKHNLTVLESSWKGRERGLP